MAGASAQQVADCTGYTPPPRRRCLQSLLSASSRCSVSHTTIPKLVAATLCGLRPFALPRSLIPPKSHAALVSFNQQHQPSLEAKLASSSSPSTIAVTACAAACSAAPPLLPHTIVCGDGRRHDGTFAAFSTNQTDFLLVGNADNALFLH